MNALINYENTKLTKLFDLRANLLLRSNSARQS